MGAPLNDRELLAQFEAQTLPFEEWTHRIHVKVGFLYVRARTLETAIKKMRAGIQAYNATNADRVRVGYHETITVAFLRLIAESLAPNPARIQLSADGFCDANPELLQRDALGRFYTSKCLSGEAARSSFVEPDLKPLSKRT